MKKVLMKHENDNVATALEDIKVGDKVSILSGSNKILSEITAKNPIPFGNKIAVKDISGCAEVQKCGYKIGIALKEIKCGELVHVHNVESEKVNFPPSIIDEILRQMGLQNIE